VSAPERGRPVRHPVDGIVLLDKPAGLTSNQALQRVRRALGAAKAGHAGTLDPMATGMLPLCFGQATKACGRILGARKAYRARLRLGAATDTGDAQGAVVARAEVPPLDAASVEHVLERFRGTIEQTPPMVSALKVGGERLYELARRGVNVSRPARRVELHRLCLLDVERDEIVLEVECSKGTYIRVLGEDIARALDTLGHLAELRRLWVAPFETEQMTSLDEITGWDENPPRGSSAPSWLLPVERALIDVPRVDVDAVDGAALRHGRSIASSAEVAEGTMVRAHDHHGMLLGLLRAGPDRRLHVMRLLIDPAPGSQGVT